jgi:FMN phosphatase YigB (HAD superfamily)
MISFLKYLREGKKVRVFDFDDTLAHTHEKVVVKNKKTGEMRQLTSAEFAQYKPHPDEHLDFSEFNDIKAGIPLKPADNIARNASRKKREVVVLTARPMVAAPAIRKYLKGRGIRGKKLTILAVGSSDPNAKRVALKDHLLRGKKLPSHVEFMDDHRANVEAVGQLQKEFPKTKFKLRVAKLHK